MIKVDWILAGASSRVSGVLLVNLFCRWLTIGNILQPMGNKDRFLQKCPKLCWTVRSKEKFT